jgi:hypothetical protein
MGWYLFSRNPATYTFFHLLKVLKLGCPILWQIASRRIPCAERWLGL